MSVLQILRLTLRLAFSIIYNIPDWQWQLIAMVMTSHLVTGPEAMFCRVNVKHSAYATTNNNVVKSHCKSNAHTTGNTFFYVKSGLLHIKMHLVQGPAIVYSVWHTHCLGQFLFFVILSKRIEMFLNWILDDCICVYTIVHFDDRNKTVLNTMTAVSLRCPALEDVWTSFHWNMEMIFLSTLLLFNFAQHSFTGQQWWEKYSDLVLFYWRKSTKVPLTIVLIMQNGPWQDYSLYIIKLSWMKLHTLLTVLYLWI